MTSASLWAYSAENLFLILQNSQTCGSGCFAFSREEPWRLAASAGACFLRKRPRSRDGTLSGALRQLPRRGSFFHLTVTKLSLWESWHCAAMTERVILHPFCYIKGKNHFLYLIFAILRAVRPCRRHRRTHSGSWWKAAHPYDSSRRTTFRRSVSAEFYRETCAAGWSHRRQER